MNIPALLRSAAFGAACLLTASATMAQETPEVRFQAISGSIGGVPLMVIEGEKLDEKYGFKGKFDFLPSDGAFQNFLIGNADISMDNDILGAAIARNEGFDVTAFYPVGNLYLGIVVDGKSKARTAEDLRGKKVGHFGADSGTTQFIRLIVQDMYGFDVLKEYNLTQVGPAALVPLLEAGEVDAIFNFEAYVSEAIAKTDGRYLLQGYKDYAAFTGGFSPWITNMIAHEEWLKENPKLAYAVRDAYDEAIKLLEESKYELLRKDYISAKLGITSPEVLDVLVKNAAESSYFTNDWTPEKITAAIDFLKKMSDDGQLLEAIPDGIMVRLEDFVGPRP